MSVSDELMWRYIDCLSFKTNAEIKQWQEDVAAGGNPRDVKLAFAEEIVARFHSDEAGSRARQDFIERFQKKIIPEDLPLQTLELAEPVFLPQLLKQIELVASTSEAMRLIRSGAVRVDEQKVEDTKLILPLDSTYLIQVGKRRLARLVLVQV